MGARFHRIVATVGGIGYLPLAPGTWAATVAVIVWYFASVNIEGFAQWQWVLVLACLLIGIYSSGKVVEDWGKDPKQVVIDEVAGMWIAILCITPTYKNLIAGFILFRFFDIVKPLWIKKTEKAGKGWGIMLDDIVAGIYAQGVLRLLILWKIW